MKSYGVTIQMKATEQYFLVVLFIILYKVVLNFESEEKIVCNQQYLRMITCEIWDLLTTIHWTGCFNNDVDP